MLKIATRPMIAKSGIQCENDCVLSFWFMIMFMFILEHFLFELCMYLGYKSSLFPLVDRTLFREQDLFYQNFRHFRCRLNRYRLDHVLAAEPGAFGEGDDTARVTIAKKAPSTFFDHYRWRGPRFSGLCLYEYVKLVVVKTMASAISTDIPFLPEHPLHQTHIQNYSER